MGSNHRTCMYMEPELFLNLKDVQAARSFARTGGFNTHRTLWNLQEMSQLLPPDSLYGPSHQGTPHSPFILHPQSPSVQSREGADRRCRKTTGLSSRDHVNIPAGATKPPAGSDWGSACARGTEEPQNNKGSLQGCVAWHWHHVFHQCCSRKTNRNLIRAAEGSFPAPSHFITYLFAKGDVICTGFASRFLSFMWQYCKGKFLFSVHKEQSSDWATTHTWCQALMKSRTAPIPCDMFRLQSRQGM